MRLVGAARAWLAVEAVFVPDPSRAGRAMRRDAWFITPDFAHQLLDLKAGSVSVSAEDLHPEIQQKGVDMRIGLDIPSLAAADPFRRSATPPRRGSGA
jgi:hypothetical protein